MKKILLFIVVFAFITAQKGNSQTYHVLSSGPFLQNWSNIGMITTSDSWTGVPSIIGYRGDDAALGTGVDPQTLLNPSFSTVVDVNANQTNPSTYTTGGVTEFEITDPVVGLTGSGTADAPNIVVYLNTVGCSDIHAQFKVRDIDGSADNSVQQFALQYRIGATGDFINIPSAYIADASSGPSLATQVTNMDVLLPAACNNAAQVELRFMTTNAPGNDEYLGIDDIAILQVLTPVISVSSPSTGDQWRQGTTHNITWTASNTNTNVMIEYTDNASAGSPTWSTLVASVPAASGSWSWVIPAGQTLGTDYKIRVTDIPATATGLSGTFSIVLPPIQLSTLAELRAVTAGTSTVYTYTGQGVLTFKQTFRKQKYIQDATAAILIDDNAGKFTTTYNLGDAITNITGTVAEFAGMLQFTPESDPGAAASTGNTITPEVVTLAQLGANWENYEAEVIKVPDVTFTNPTGNFANGVIYPVTDINGTGADFRTTFYDVDYITKPIPTVREDLVVIPNSRIDGNHITSRNLADFIYNTSNNIVLTELMYNPQDGGNDTIEFIELYNSGSIGVNLKDWYFASGVTYVFPDITLAAGAYYLIAREPAAMQNTFGITCPQWSAGFLDDAGEAVVLKDALHQTTDSVYYLPTAPWPTTPNNGGPSLTLCDPTLNNALPESWSASTNQVAVNGAGQPVYASPGAGCSSGANLVMTEIMYNSPESGNDSLEFVELYNAGNTFDLEGFHFTDGFVYEFPSYTFNSGEYLLVALNSAAIQNTFGKTSLQWTSGALSNSGEAITLRDNFGIVIDQVTYATAAPWPAAANGQGPSLTLCDPNSNNALPESWKASSEYVTMNAAGDSIFATPLGGCLNPPTVANFDATPTFVYEGGSIQFHDLSSHNPTAWEWTFPGGTPATSIEQNPLIQYTAFGVYSVTLKATNAYGNNTLTKTDYISVGVDGITTLPYTTSVYPNPTNGKLFITNPSNSLQEITILSAVGKQILTVTSAEDIISLDISGQSSGIYMVKITNKSTQSNQIRKIILK